MKLTIEMPWERDLSVNHMRYGAGGGYRKKEHVQSWMEALQWETWGQMATQNTEWLKIRVPVTVKVDFRYPDKRKRDDHNFYKVICDAVAAGLGIDDKDIRISTGTIEVDRANPGFTITVEDSDERG